MSEGHESDGLLSVEDILLLYLYREGAYEGTKSGLAGKLGYPEGSYVGRKLDELEGKGLIQQLPDEMGYELTPKGIRRMRLFGVPRLLIGLSVAVSAFLVVAGAADLLFGIAASPIGLFLTGLVTLACSFLFLYYQLITEKQVMKRRVKHVN